MNSTNHKQRILAFHSCHQGASHKKTGKVCQDYAFARYKKEVDSYAVAIVSDGHGNNNYFRSDRGSRMAVEAAKDAINEFMKNFLKPKSRKRLLEIYTPDDFMRQLETAVVYKWRIKIKNDYDNEPFTESDLALMTPEACRKYKDNPEKYFVKVYGATLIAVVIYPKHFWFGLHIGDGKCVAQYADEHFDQPIAWDEKCFLNVTTSLCDEKPLDNFRHCFHTDNFPTAIFVGSDGVDDCFVNDEDLYGFYQEVIRTCHEKKFKEKECCKELDEFLPVMSEKGSGDDISVGGILML